MSDVKKLFVIGAGFMGMGIVQTAAMHGFKVKVFDKNPDAAKNGIQKVGALFDKGIAKGKYTDEQKSEWLGNMFVATDISECCEADYIIEAIAENEEIKKEIFKVVDTYAKADAVIASNTSSISITALASVLSNPANFIGLHFFSPVPVMGLLEIVRGLLTSDECATKAREFGKLMGKTSITSKDESGFIVNRLCIPMLNEACVLLERQVSTIEEIDTGVKLGLNHPMGPLELADMIGIDICLSIMTVLHKETGDDKYRAASTLRRMVNAGLLGRKSGEGYYIYNADGTKTPNPKLDVVNCTHCQGERA